MNEPSNTETELPFLAPCKQLSICAPLKWLTLGWQDMQRAPAPSLVYGAALVIASYGITFIALTLRNYFSLMALASGFVFLGPVLAMAFYEISLKLQAHQSPSISSSLKASLKHLSNQMVFTLVLVIIFLIWARAASMIHIFFPSSSGASLADFAAFLSIGTLVGSLFSALVFCISAFSLPMIVAKNTDAITAVVTSFNAVLRNKFVMVVWASLIVAAVAIGLLTGFLGFMITLPLIGHATWHAYQDTIDASAWPDNV
jgi:uncharacterized membrane protein